MEQGPGHTNTPVYLYHKYVTLPWYLDYSLEKNRNSRTPQRLTGTHARTAVYTSD